MIMILDFDGTCVKNAFPNIGADIGAIEVLKRFKEKEGNKIILFTMRSNRKGQRQYLKEAKDWFETNGIELYGVNKNPDQSSWTNSPKPYGDVIIDDNALGIPLIRPRGKKPYVDWIEVESLLESKGAFK